MKYPSIAFVSTYVPKQCGMATFTHDMATAASQAMGVPLGENPNVRIVAVHDPQDAFLYGPEVGFLIRQRQRKDYAEAAEYLNISPVNAVCIQHEYGIFGGDDGKYILDLLEGLRKPVVSIFHTVLSNPSEGQKNTLKRIAELSSHVTVMAKRAKAMLADAYGVPPEKITHIYHGVPDLPYLDPAYYKDKFQLEGKKVLLTFGLISPGKGIEHAIDAMAALAGDFPNLVYVILGATHPEVKRNFGEVYRTMLEQRAEALGLKDQVIFYDRYVSDAELSEFLLMADLYVTPYLSREQMSSGTLSFAMSSGKAVVSTPYWYAEEVLAEGRGLLVPFADAEALADQLRLLLSDEVEYNRMRKRAYQFSRKMVWKEVGRVYCDIFKRAAESGVPRAASRKMLPSTLPEIRLDHLRRMTDGTGLLQHALYSTPWRQHGYTTDDNARALRFVIRYRSFFRDDSVLPLAQTYLAFLVHAFNEKTGRFRGHLGYDRTWSDDAGSEDCQGRALVALADTLVAAQGDALAAIAKEIFDRALGPLKGFTAPRAWSWVILACDRYLKRFGGVREVRRLRDYMAHRLLDIFQEHTTPEWPWPENEVTYDNARLCEALILAGQVTDHGEKVSLGTKTLEWLLKVQTAPENEHLSLIGNNGWMTREGKRARFDQQPLEASALLSACQVAYHATSDKKWLWGMKKCFGWFLGSNDLNVPLYDFKTHGCHDGLHEDGASENQGAESTLAWLSALLAMHEEGL
jgi:glycosyltransferase involved in cell wall biosynthesis